MLRANSVISLTAVREALLDAEAIRRRAERDPLRYWEWMRAHSAARDRAGATMRGNGELQPQQTWFALNGPIVPPVAPLPLPDEAHPVSGDDHRITVKTSHEEGKWAPETVAAGVDRASARKAEFHGVFTRPDAAQLGDIACVVDMGAIRASVSKTYGLDQLASAYDTLASGHTRGKLVIVPEGLVSVNRLQRLTRPFSDNSRSWYADRRSDPTPNDSPVSHISSTLRWASRSSLRLEVGLHSAFGWRP